MSKRVTAWYDQLDPLSRKAVVFLKLYEIERKKKQFGYKLSNERLLESVTFKQARTLVEWLEDLGWVISWKKCHWQGFLKFVFKAVDPAIPQPGQFKNKILLSKYITSLPDQDVYERAPVEQTDIYIRVLRPEMKSMYGLLGL